MFMGFRDPLKRGNQSHLLPQYAQAYRQVRNGPKPECYSTALNGCPSSVGAFKCSTYSFRSLDNNLPSVHAHKESTPREAELSRSHEGLNGLRNQQRVGIKHSFGILRIAPVAGTIFS